jgi:hypothetical protein
MTWNSEFNPHRIYDEIDFQDLKVGDEFLSTINNKKNMNQVLLKFAKGALTGGLSGIGLALAVGVSAHSLDDLKGIAIILVTAFLSGAFHAIVEMIKPTLPATTETVVTTTTPTV